MRPRLRRLHAVSHCRQKNSEGSWTVDDPQNAGFLYWRCLVERTAPRRKACHLLCRHKHAEVKPLPPDRKSAHEHSPSQYPGFLQRAIDGIKSRRHGLQASGGIGRLAVSKDSRRLSSGALSTGGTKHQDFRTDVTSCPCDGRATLEENTLKHQTTSP